MNTNEITNDIEERISIINPSIDNFWIRLNYGDLTIDDINSLEKILKRVSGMFRFNYIMSIVLLGLLWVLSFLTFLEIIDSEHLRKSAVFIIVMTPFVVNAYKAYKVKVNLEYKIYLLRLLEKIEKA